MVNYGTTRSTVKPPELEVTDTKVFVASKIHEITATDPETQEEHIEYEYNLLEYEKNEYIHILHQEQEEQNEVLDYLLMEG